MAEIIQDLTLLLLVSLPINLLFHKIKWPSVMGYLLAGVLIGPHAMGWIADPKSVEDLAEIGIILLLFLIGLEFSLSHLLENVIRVVGAGFLQLALIAGSVYLLAPSIGIPAQSGILLGILIGLSSTAIILKVITDRAEIDTAYGRLGIGILLLQDVCVLPLMLLIPLLGGETLPGWDLALALLKSVAAVGGMFFASRLLVPRILHSIARFGTREHLTLFVILLILGTAWVAHHLGLTLAMGAFIAGMILSESDYQHQISLDILPVKDYFGSIFFISVGMLLNLPLFWNHVGGYLGATAGLILLKGVLTGVAVWLMRYPAGVAAAAGLFLAQAGEFSLILGGLAYQNNVLPEMVYQDFLIVALLSMLAAPPLIQWFSPWVKRWIDANAKPESIKPPTGMDELNRHVIIAGYSMIGQHLTRVLHEIKIPFLVIERDAEKLKQAMMHQAPVLYGDSTQRETLQRAKLDTARMLVVSLADLKATGQVIRLARRLNPELYILARTTSDTHVEVLTDAGANLVIPEEFETSIEIFTRVLREYRIPNPVIEQQIELVRMEGYSMFRGVSLNSESLRKFSTYLTASLTESVPIEASSAVVGQSVGSLKLKERTGARMIAVVRNSEIHANPEHSFELQQGDLLILFGRHAALDKAIRLIQQCDAPEDESKQLET